MCDATRRVASPYSRSARPTCPRPSSWREPDQRRPTGRPGSRCGRFRRHRSNRAERPRVQGGGQRPALEDLRGHAEPVLHQPDAALEFDGPVLAPQRDLGDTLVEGLQHALPHAGVAPEQVRRRRQGLRLRARSRRHQGVFEVEDPGPEDLQGRQSEGSARSTVTSHPAIARSKSHPPANFTTSTTPAATTCSRYLMSSPPSWAARSPGPVSPRTA